MDRGTMRLLVYIFSAAVTVQSELASSHGFLKGAVAGFDPFYMTSIVAPNPGKRSSLFQHLWGCYYDNQVVPSSFINNEEEDNCLPEITVRSIVNYKDFKDFSSSSAYELASDANWGTSVGYDNFTSCEGENNALDRTMLQFFRNTRGEVVLATSLCVTHTISISPFEPVSFTPAFQSALVALYKATLNPISVIQKTTFAEFIRFYGTHFSRRTRLGSKVIFGKLFSTPAATVDEETARRRCVREAVLGALIPGARMINETTRTVFTRAMSDKCGGKEHEAIVSITGPLPERSLEDWASAAKKFPQPIFHDLEPLSTLFNKDWFDIIHQSMQLKMNGSALYNFFSEHFADYSSRMMCGGSNKSPSRGCTLDSNCTDGTECRSEPYTTSGYICVPKHDATTTTTTTSTTTTQAATTSTTSIKAPRPTTTTTLRPCPAGQTCPTLPGPVLMMGGLNDQGGSAAYLSSGDAIATWTLPSLPYAAEGGTLAAVGSKIYSCGGRRSGTELVSSCYVLDRASHSPHWNSIVSLPTQMHHHTSVTIADHIWTVYSGKLYDLNTKENKFRTFHLPLTVSSGHCAVSNGSHSFIIGAGTSRNEIWVNTQENNPANWHRVGHLMSARRYFGCVLFEQEVFITGGEYSRTDAVVFDTVTHALRSAGALVQGRGYHRMMVFEGKPAVVGGYSGSRSLASIETYDQRTWQWTTSRRSLAKVRHVFGLVQVPL